ncbi:MAG TPA: hypothetical protein PKM67_01500 [Kiritimatiellia bacterium]|nr:hypothetical protein [Kiritimatiellia bacterium]HNS80118.1 hypothetical protein [Kiritimatiellia bacterium]HPA77426.1 hypothetical protein [Kiritimatiellia bacterium]HQQ03533.1 hypothetical protein [Kiritimatiellia bacterium]
MKKIISIALLAGLLLCPASRARDAALVRQQYDMVKSRLDDGGDLMIVANVDGLVEAGVQKLVEMASMAASTQPSAPGLPAALEKLPAFLKANGFYAVTAVGFSAVPKDNGLNTIKAFVGRDAAAAALPLWRGLFGLQGIEMITPAYLPADTEIVRTFAADPEQLWKLSREAVTRLGTPEGAMAFEQSLAMSTMMLGVPLDTLISSLGGEGFLSMQLSKTASAELPLGGAGKTMTVAEPSVLLGFTVKDETLATLIKTRFCGEGLPAALTEKDGAEIITMSMKLPSPIPMQITLAVKSNVFLIGSNPGVINRALAAAESGEGLLASEKFKTAFGSLPMKNNGMMYFSPECAEFFKTIQQAAVMNDSGADADMNAAIMKLFGSDEPQQSAMVILNTRNGIQLQGNTTFSGRDVLAGAVFAPVGIVAGMMLPAVSSARAKAQTVACMNNLRQIQAAKDQWAIEKGMERGAPVSPSDIEPYLREIPTCPAGGSYILNAVGEEPTCDHPGHGMK